MLAGAARAGVLAHRRSTSACDSMGVNSECQCLSAAGQRAELIPLFPNVQSCSCPWAR